MVFLRLFDGHMKHKTKSLKLKQKKETKNDKLLLPLRILAHEYFENVPASQAVRIHLVVEQKLQVLCVALF